MTPPKTPKPRKTAHRGQQPKVPGARTTARGGRDRTGAPAGSRTMPGGPKEPEKDVHDPDGVRLQKVLAQAGVASRRASEDLIEAGRVVVDGTTVRELGVRIDPKTAIVHVDGVRLQLDTSLIYLALNKPPGVVTTMSDPEGRPCVGDILSQRPNALDERLFHVGRLDTATEGLLLLTNDGDLTHRLTHPSHEVPKTYLAEVAGPVKQDIGKKLRAGVELEDGPVKADSFRMVDSRPGKALLEITLHEGRNHIVRRMLAEVGYPVLQLCRIQIGPVKMGGLRSGRTRAIHGEELSKLFEAVGL
ncbi:pseudouridine synthase [Kineosporia mesophila]|uniref:Pseudouridine synthase n=1 Tax=Kineosporia mesophila TaxID=566012 RepID=A0ABP6ZWE4_9ACTN|nr:pseudouridine synthase [Kineosporia mesophila]MCD5353307.1 rRNA pseudouridine synthase [Kineosporia mesophila]